MRDYLIVADVMAIHDDQVAIYGGASGARDPGQLEATLFRPQTGYYGDLVAEAAALWESLSQNHPFVDGNKRTAFAATFTFLVINGLGITASADEAWSFLSDRYETGTMKFDMLDAWLRDNTAPA
ncbi:MAG: type II toxin-antitoxin system death-on-curing family toxin [Anderseniella sp.]|jgi:death-on-curing protein|nr:type II toxin-antitoxin system death-on-curing family toxin [Anderseniella sp.]